MSNYRTIALEGITVIQHCLESRSGVVEKVITNLK